MNAQMYRKSQQVKNLIPHETAARPGELSGLGSNTFYQIQIQIQKFGFFKYKYKYKYFAKV